MTDRVILQREFSELYGLHKSLVKYATDRAELHLEIKLKNRKSGEVDS